jgi:glucan 1,3-beta-glucosidase
MAANRSDVPYDPLLEVPSSPRLPPDHEFGLPQPGFLEHGSRNSSASSMNYRQSEYGSIAGLRPNSGLPSGAGVPTSGPSSYRDHPNGTKEHLPMTELHDSRTASYDLHEKNNIYEAPRKRSKRKLVLCAAICGGLLVVILAVALPVYFFVIKPKQGGDDGSSGSSNTHHTGNNTNNQPQQHVVTTGGDGSTVTKEDGTTFVYNNTFGGIWVDDPNNPLNNSAQAQTWSPPLSEEWRWGVDNIYGYVPRFCEFSKNLLSLVSTLVVG